MDRKLNSEHGALSINTDNLIWDPCPFANWPFFLAFPREVPATSLIPVVVYTRVESERKITTRFLAWASKHGYASCKQVTSLAGMALGTR